MTMQAVIESAEIENARRSAIHCPRNAIIYPPNRGARVSHFDARRLFKPYPAPRV